jgi:hypothetical protein
MDGIPSISLCPEFLDGYLDIDFTPDLPVIYFFPVGFISESHHMACSQFLICSVLPTIISSKLRRRDAIAIDLSVYTSFSATGREITLHRDRYSKTLTFPTPFHLCSFLSVLAARCTFLGGSLGARPPRDPRALPPPPREASAENRSNLFAHDSLLQYLGFDSSRLRRLNDAQVLTLLEFPGDAAARAAVASSLVPVPLQRLCLFLLLLDIEDGNSPLSVCRTPPVARWGEAAPPRRLSGVVPALPILPASPRPLWAIDGLGLGGAGDICTDYDCLCAQWSGMTSRQLAHCPLMRESMLALEAAIKHAFPVGHPLARANFNAMVCFFVLREEWRRLSPDLLRILIGVSLLWHPAESVCDEDVPEAHHVIFWMFVALLNKTGILEVSKHQDKIAQKCSEDLMLMHPILCTAVQGAGLDSLRRPVQIICSLYADVLATEKLWAVWIAALASGNPMGFFHLLMTLALIMIFPQTVGADDLALAIDGALVKFFEATSTEFMIANALKLKKSFDRHAWATGKHG